MIPTRRVGARVAHTLLATVLSGILTYVVLAMVSRTLDPGAFDAFSVFWSISLIIGFGFFLPIEQESARLGRDADAAAALPAALMQATALVVLIVGVLAVAFIPVAIGALGMTPALALATVLVVVASGVQFAGRGRLLAEGRSVAFANTLILDTVLRVALLGAVGVAAASGSLQQADALYAIALMVAIVAAHAWAVPWKAWRPHAVLGATFRRALGVLVATSLCAQVLVNAGPILIQASSAGDGLAGAFQASSMLARVPLAIITPIQAMLVGPIAARVLAGQSSALRGMMRSVAVAAVMIAAAGAFVGWMVGPWLVDLIFGPGRALPAQDIAILIAGVVVHVALIVLTQAVIAAGRHRSALVSWACAVGAAGLVFAALVTAAGPVLAVELGFGVGSLVGAAITYGMLMRSARLTERPTTAERGV